MKTSPTKEKKVTKKAATKASKKVESKPTGPVVVITPRITEKAAGLSGKSVYTFNIPLSATKRDVALAIKAEYKVTPLKINIVRTPASRVRLRTRRGFGTTTRSKKAYVFLKKGDRIEFSA